MPKRQARKWGRRLRVELGLASTCLLCKLSWKYVVKPIEITITWLEEVCQTGEKDKRKEQVWIRLVCPINILSDIPVSQQKTNSTQSFTRVGCMYNDNHPRHFFTDYYLREAYVFLKNKPHLTCFSYIWSRLNSFIQAYYSSLLGKTWNRICYISRSYIFVGLYVQNLAVGFFYYCLVKFISKKQTLFQLLPKRTLAFVFLVASYIIHFWKKKWNPMSDKQES